MTWVFGFKPADQELINFFLYRKVVLRQPLVPRHVGFVHEIDLLGDHQPWEIWDACGGPQPYGKQAYFFCKLKKLSKSGVHIDRRNASEGFWNGKQLSEDVFVHHDVNPNNKWIIGRKRQFKYVNEGSEHHHDWYLETYILASIPDDDQAVVAICRLRKNYHKRKRYVPQRNRRRINGRKERHGRRINGQLMETKR
ncbi:NAC domain-containing protein 89-like [Pyrus communis]|uniref:NAC domain-containing protein 89-like n=1 Tax=Pyrus communis TaxID=23211 RepID=UPI0035BEEDC8